ncbi:16S/23S rRNA (cytidine-2'-O)-methyltransferase TlyA [Arthrobacter agilis]|uniref:TlyA family RNA methyltransferase n=1 Tax=Arthrobacter agilis TaxID=37921 RepID=UPI000B582593|nr:TlyA family RNA methyltransferase [Arthrobacter agilis]OUM45349.1 16S/23S rRNA (cytidine-2'-O)-methyltransferase [Arthrobacter agilis]VDR31757.1 16S/23S rRNA (cytidine-2'-O)-methyltransferase TlyA [Arthrobacter agilis]
MARLDQELVARGLARSRSHAAQLIDAGRVLRGGTVLRKPSAPILPTDVLLVEERGEEWVSRAGTKLDGALRAFPAIDPLGKRCLDAGASTGGFTDVLLRRGAREVAAVDVGHGQLVQQLREDPRVLVFEGMNVRHLVPAAIGGPVRLTVADLSFISLTLVLPALAGATEHGGDLVLMVKPQFEVGRSGLNRLGIVTATDARRRAVGGVLRSALELGLEARGLAQSDLPGQDGNLEYFVWIKVPRGELMPRIGEERDLAVEQVLAESHLFPMPGRPTDQTELDE